MKKILGIIGSVRKMGNSELMIKEIYKNIRIPTKLKLLRLTDFNLKPCIGCYNCLFGDRKCLLNDDMYSILEAIVDADALILAAPTYFLGIHSSLKLFLDRGMSFYKYMDELWGKPSVGIALAGIKGKEGSALLGIENFLKLILSNIKETQVVYGALPGEVILENNNREIAKNLSESLFSEVVKQKNIPHCSLCGGDSFRFIGIRKLKCMLCSNEGDMEIDKEGTINISMSIDENKHQFFLTKESVIYHKNWLVKMKEKFKLKREELNKVFDQYSDKNDWIKP